MTDASDPKETGGERYRRITAECVREDYKALYPINRPSRREGSAVVLAIMWAARLVSDTISDATPV